MPLRDDVLSETLTQGPKCPVAILLTKLSPGEQVELVDVLADGTVQHTAISRWSATRGKRIPDTSIGNHRRGTCSCAQAERLRT